MNIKIKLQACIQQRTVAIPAYNFCLCVLVSDAVQRLQCTASICSTERPSQLNTNMEH